MYFLLSLFAAKRSLLTKILARALILIYRRPPLRDPGPNLTGDIVDNSLAEMGAFVTIWLTGKDVIERRIGFARRRIAWRVVSLGQGD